MNLEKSEILQLRGGGAIPGQCQDLPHRQSLANSLTVSREDQVCFQLKRLVLSVHWANMLGITLVVQPTDL